MSQTSSSEQLFGFTEEETMESGYFLRSKQERTTTQELEEMPTDIIKVDMQEPPKKKSEDPLHILIGMMESLKHDMVENNKSLKDDIVKINESLKHDINKNNVALEQIRLDNQSIEQNMQRLGESISKKLEIAEENIRRDLGRELENIKTETNNKLDEMKKHVINLHQNQETQKEEIKQVEDKLDLHIIEAHNVIQHVNTRQGVFEEKVAEQFNQTNIKLNTIKEEASKTLFGNVQVLNCHYLKRMQEVDGRDKFGNFSDGIPYDFLKRLESNYRNWGNKEDLRDFISSFMTGEAEVWWTLIKDKINSFEEFVSNFKEEYCGTKFMNYAVTKLNTGNYDHKSKNDPAKYIASMIKLSMASGLYKEEAELTKVIANHFNRIVYETVITRGFTTIKELSDNATCFTTSKWSDFLRDLGIKRILTAIRRPESNLSERVNREVLTQLRIKLTGQHKAWVKYVKSIEDNLNTTYHCSINNIPYCVFYKARPPRPWDARDTDYKLSDEEYEKIIKEVDRLREQNYQRAGVKKKEKKYKKGELVLVKALCTANADVGQVKKLGLKFEGPYIVEERLGANTYALIHVGSRELRGIFHASLMKQYYLPDWKNKQGVG